MKCFVYKNEKDSNKGKNKTFWLFEQIKTRKICEENFFFIKIPTGIVLMAEYWQFGHPSSLCFFFFATWFSKPKFTKY